MKTTLLSIDWDFFIYNPNEIDGAKILAYPGTPQEREISSYSLFDWGSNEAWNSMLGQLLWVSRAVGCLNVGVDMQKIMCIRPS